MQLIFTLISSLIITTGILLQTGRFKANPDEIGAVTEEQLKSYRIQTVSPLLNDHEKSLHNPLLQTCDNDISASSKFSPAPYSVIPIPLSIIYDLKFIYSLSKIKIYNEGSGSGIRNYRIFTSADGKTYKLTYTGETLPDKEGYTSAEFPQVKARYVKLEILDHYGEHPEFREIDFFSATPVSFDSKEHSEKNGFIPLENAVLIKEFAPEKHTIKNAEMKSVQDNKYFYDASLIRLPLTNDHHAYLEIKFYEPEMIDRMIQIRIPECSYQTNLIIKAKTPVVFYFNPSANRISSKEAYTLLIKKISGPNVFLGSIGIYKNITTQIQKTDEQTVKVFSFKQKITNTDLFFNRSILTNLKRLYKTKNIFITKDSGGYWFDIHFPDYRLEETTGVSLDLFLDFNHKTPINYNNKIFHFNIPLMKRVGEKPVIRLIKHLGQTYEPSADILNDFKNFFYSVQSEIDAEINTSNGVNFKLYLPAMKTINTEKLRAVNYRILYPTDKTNYKRFIQNFKQPDETPVSILNKEISEDYFNLFAISEVKNFLAASSDQPDYFAPAEHIDYQKPHIDLTDKIFKNQNISIKVTDPFINTSSPQSYTSRLFINALKTNLNTNVVLKGQREGKITCKYTYKIPADISGNRFTVNYKTKILDLQKSVAIKTGHNGYISFDHKKDNKYYENETLTVRVSDKDRNQKPEDIEDVHISLNFDYIHNQDNQTGSVKELTLKETSQNSGIFETRYKLPSVNSFHKEITFYTLKIIYEDNINENGMSPETRKKNLKVFKNIPIFNYKPGHPVVVKRETLPPLIIIPSEDLTNIKIKISSKNQRTKNGHHDTAHTAQRSLFPCFRFFINPEEKGSVYDSRDGLDLFFIENFITVTNELKKIKLKTNITHRLRTNFFKKNIRITNYIPHYKTNMITNLFVLTNTITFTNIYLTNTNQYVKTKDSVVSNTNERRSFLTTLSNIYTVKNILSNKVILTNISASYKKTYHDYQELDYKTKKIVITNLTQTMITNQTIKYKHFFRHKGGSLINIRSWEKSPYLYVSKTENHTILNIDLEKAGMSLKSNNLNFYFNAVYYENNTKTLPYILSEEKELSKSALFQPEEKSLP